MIQRGDLAISGRSCANRFWNCDPEHFANHGTIYRDRNCTYYPFLGIERGNKTANSEYFRRRLHDSARTAGTANVSESHRKEMHDPALSMVVVVLLLHALPRRSIRSHSTHCSRFLVAVLQSRQRGITIRLFREVVAYAVGLSVRLYDRPENRMPSNGIPVFSKSVQGITKMREVFFKSV